MTTFRHFLDLAAMHTQDLRHILDASHAMKKARASLKGKVLPDADTPMKGKLLAMVFERPSTRTRVSFDVAMRQLGGETLYLSGAEMQIGRGETLADTARVLSRYVDMIMIRILDHHALQELAEHASVPVINGLTRFSHPCQIMADLMTYEERKGSIEGATVAWLGDANNVLTSWVHAAAKFNFKMIIASPVELSPPASLFEWAAQHGADVRLTRSPEEAADQADAIITDTWVSMGDKERERRHALLTPYRVNETMMGYAKKDAIFLHCLPAHRGEEVTDAVIDGPQSAVFDEAENRLHAQKGVLKWCLGL